jgi:hypothetical protein
VFEELVCVLTLLIALQGRASAALSGSFTCLGSTTFGTVVPAKNSTISTLSELMHLNLTVGATPGTLTVNFFGEVCKFTLSTLTLSVDATGQGTMTFSFNPNISDLDKDYACGSNLFGRTSTITEHYIITTAASNTKFYFVGGDDFITPTTTDNGDFFTPSGVCEKQ